MIDIDIMETCRFSFVIGFMIWIKKTTQYTYIYLLPDSYERDITSSVEILIAEWMTLWGFKSFPAEQSAWWNDMAVARFDFLLIMVIRLPYYRLRNWPCILLIFTHVFLWNTKRNDFLMTLEFEGSNFYKTQCDGIHLLAPIIALIRRWYKSWSNTVSKK